MKTIKKKPGRTVLWRPRCSVCQFCKRNPEFRRQLFESSYFTDSKTSPMKVNKQYGSPFKQAMLYSCLRTHHHQEIVRPPTHIDEKGQVILDNRYKPTFEVIESIPTGSTSNHELGLDDFIAKGRVMLAKGELRITASTFLTAVKTKMDNEARTKDRRADMLQGLFKGAAPKRDV